MAKLRQNQQFRLWNHLQTNIGEYMERRPNKVELAKKLTEELGFEVKQSHINGTLRNMKMGWVSPSSRVRERVVNKVKLDNRVYVGRERWQAIVTVLEKLCGEFNIDFPAVLK
jgi:hypothetical protein